jgi:CHAD domain-containing protein
MTTAFYAFDECHVNFIDWIFVGVAIVRIAIQRPYDPVVALLKQRTQRFFEQMPKALGGDEEAVHQLRVSCRRLRVALLALSLKPGSRRIRNLRGQLRDMTRGAGLSRDLDVMLALFDRRVKDVGHNPDRTLLRRRLYAVRHRRRKSMAERLLDLDIAGVRRGLRALPSRFTAKTESVVERVRELSASEGETIIESLETLESRLDVERLHAIRRRARKMRYLAEILNALRHTETEAPVLMKNVQEKLGALRDANMLAEWLMQQARQSEDRARATEAAAAAKEARFFRSVVRRTHGEFVECRPQELIKRTLSLTGSAHDMYSNRTPSERSTTGR